MVFLDEMGCKTNLHRSMGWAPVGETPVLIASRYGTHLTMVGAIAMNGMRAASIFEGSFDGPAFVTWLDEELGPTLSPGEVVVMDGPNLHRVDGVEQTLEKYGARVLYLPPYSPEFNPIEMCWSWMKALIRKRIPRVVARLRLAMIEARDAVTPELCRAWIRHAYPNPST